MLTRLVSTEVLHKLQDRFSDLGRVTVCIGAIDGRPITEPTWGSRFSELIGTSPRGRASFAESIRTLAADPDAKVPSMCHEGMTLYAAPIEHNGARLGIIAVGTRAPTPPSPETVRKLATAYEVDPDELLASIDHIDPHSGGSPEAIRRFADTLADTIAILYGQAARIKTQYTDLRTVHQLSQLLSDTTDVQEILDVTVRRVVEVMPVKACGIRLLDEDTGELVISAVHNLSEEYQRKGPVTLQGNAIDSAAFRGEAVYIENVATDPRSRYPQNARREGIVSGLCVPMTYRGQTVGVMRAYTARRYTFSDSETALLRSMASQAASAIINSRLYEEQVTAERFQRQVRAAGEIQRRMLPAELPQRKGLEFGCVYDPSLQVGGDFYDFIEMPDGRLGVCVADVVGKGLPAALMMASVRSALRAQSPCAADIEAAVSAVNRHMCRDTLGSEFATLVYGVFSADGRTFTYSNAGHPPPILLRGDRFITLEVGGLVIGVRPDTVFEHEAIALQPGDVLVMITDGVIEALDFQAIAYGRARLLASVKKYRELDATQLAQQILWDVRRFVGLADQSDDITVVVTKVTG